MKSPVGVKRKQIKHYNVCGHLDEECVYMCVDGHELTRNCEGVAIWKEKGDKKSYPEERIHLPGRLRMVP